jgi:GntR family transcriptional repressor for pyruvate dehydrogenase complex
MMRKDDIAPNRAMTLWGEPIVSRHVADEVVDRLVTAVALGLYVPDQQLPTERDLATMLGVSRTSVREALKKLTETGYLGVRRGRTGGYFVRLPWGPNSAEHVRRQVVAKWPAFEQIFDARILVERGIAGAAAQRRTEADLRTISIALEAYGAAPDHDASRRADASLHLAIAQATQNTVLIDLSVDFRTKISLNLGAEPYSDEIRQIAIGQHRELVGAVAAGQADAAAEIAARHFALSERLFRELVDLVIAGDQRGVP